MGSISADTPSIPGNDAPWPRVSTPRLTNPQRRTNRERKTGGSSGEPSLLFDHHLRTELSTGQAHCQGVAKPIGRVVPTASEKTKMFARQIGVLVGEQRKHEIIGNLNLRGRDTRWWDSAEIRHLRGSPRDA